MGKANCRDTKICIFCNMWMGTPPDTNYATGMSKFTNKRGMCKNDGEMHTPEDLCSYFNKKLMYQ